MKRLSSLVAALVAALCLAPLAPAAATTLAPPQTIMGPRADIDSLYVTVRDGHGLHGLMSMYDSYWHDQRPDGSLVNERRILRHGAEGSLDQCGVHPVGSFYKVPHQPGHWVTFYHAEQHAPVDDHCNHRDRHTRWSIRRLETFDSGRTWHKGGQVITQDTTLLTEPDGTWSYRTDDAGSPRLVVRNGYFYLFYRAANRHSRMQRMSIARSPVGTLGAVGTWRKHFDGAWTEPGLGGQQSEVPGLAATARGISRNTYLHTYLAVQVDVEGIRLFRSDDLMHWTSYATLMRTGRTGSVWNLPCHRRTGLALAMGYGSIVGYYGSSSSGRRFWVYYMRKPAGTCFDHRYLVRRLVTLS